MCLSYLERSANMYNIPNSIIRKYDIRGIFNKELTKDTAMLIGKAFGTYLNKKGEKIAIVGRDNRKSSPKLYRSLVDGIISTGIDVVDIGIVITPVFYYSTYLYKIKGGIMITASHNPPEYNGFKIQYDGRTLYGQELLEIKHVADKRIFNKGEGKLATKDPKDDYIKNIEQKMKLDNKKLKVVVDCGNGTASLFAEDLLKKLGCEVIPIYCKSDPNFPNHFPDPVKEENLKDLIKKVLEVKADLGVAFDGDGDRLGVVDELGNIIWGDKLMILYWREILKKHKNQDAIVEVKCSNALVDEIKKLGGKPFFYKTGHSLIKAKMKEINAIFTGEMSGHMFFADEYYGFDDALYACARLLRILSRSNQSLSKMLKDIPKYYSTPEIRVDCPDEKKFKVVENALKYFKEKHMDMITVDGVRVNFEKGWGLIRASNTGPQLILRCESKDKHELEYIKKELKDAISHK